MSKEQDIVEGNKLIAVFMGYKWEIPDYNLSWDLLMPVVFKIRDYEKSVKKASGVLFAIAVDYKTMTIESVWQAVVKFIQWYQQNQKPQ